MDPKQLASHLDLANHHPNATPQDISILCQKVLTYGFNAAFVNATYVPLALQTLNHQAKIGTVVSFPLGQDSLESKVASATQSINLGADEVDVSVNIALFKAGLWDQAALEIKTISSAVHSLDPHKIVKIIIETGYLDSQEITTAAKLVVDSGADFVKTCSGLGPRGATLEDVHLIRQAIGSDFPIKVAGGVQTHDQALAFLQAGANRIGTSHAIDIVENRTPSTPSSGE